MSTVKTNDVRTVIGLNNMPLKESMLVMMLRFSERQIKSVLAVYDSAKCTLKKGKWSYEG